MKKLIQLIAMVLCHYTLQAQSIGINTITPDPSAALDIQSTNKGLLIPKVSLSSGIDNLTIPTPATGLLIFNTNSNMSKGAGFYYNANTPASPSWKNVNELKLPYYDAVSDNNAAFQIENYKNGSNSTAIKGYSPNGTGIHAKSEAIALKAEGGVKIFGYGQSPQTGKVLTSDALGNATWEGGIAFRASGIKGGGSEKIAKNTETKIPYNTEEYDAASNYNDANNSPHSTFTAPVKGIYHFDAMLCWTYSNFDHTKMFTTRCKLKRVRNGATTDIVECINTTASYNTNVLSTDVKLEAGDQIFTTFFQEGFDYIYLFTEPTKSYFCGRLVMKQ